VETAFVAITKLAESLPAGTVTDLGTETDVSLLERVTIKLPENTFALRFTIPVDEVPPVTLEGFALTRASDAVPMVNVFVSDLPPSVAVIVAVPEVATGFVAIVKVPLLCPAGTIAVEGTVADGLELTSETVVPLGPAGPESVTVPVAVSPPPTLEGSRVSAVNSAGLMVRVAAICPVPAPALTTTVD